MNAPLTPAPVSAALAPDDAALPAAAASIQDILGSGRPLLYLQSAEEDRVVGLFSRIARSGPGADLFLWSLTEGLTLNGAPYARQPASPRAMLDLVIAHDRPALFVLRDFHEFIRDSAEIRRRLRDLYYQCLNTGKFTVVCSPSKIIPEEIDREVAYCELPRPDFSELSELLAAEVRAIPGASGTQLPAEVLEALTRAVQGLSFHEARHALRHAMAEHGALDGSIVRTLEQEKQQLVRKTGLIEFVPNAPGIDQIGGLENLKTWLSQRRGLFFNRESISSEIVPKGLMLMGVSGCGKSLSARAVANVFGLPLYRIDMVQVFSSGIAEAERRFSTACRTLENVAPAVAWFDEIENGISRQHQDNSGVLDRIFGFFLTWMQEKAAGLFVVATANRIDLLPAEMIRKGRFDQVFFIDLPDREERLEVFKIHISRRGLDLSGLHLDDIADRTEGWTGAEIEQAVVASVIAARISNEAVADKHLYQSLRQTVPLSRTMKEQVSYIRSWASDRAVRASRRRI